MATHTTSRSAANPSMPELGKNAIVDLMSRLDSLVESEMFGILKKLVRADDGTVQVELIHDLPPARSGIDPELLAKVEELVGGKAYSVPYGTEMAVFGKLNPNIMVLGPGKETMAHQADEWVDIRDVLRAAGVYVELANLL